MTEIPNCFYRISIKALILNETRDKFLICEESDGRWELPGGGLNWNTTPHEDLPREIMEEMGIKVSWIADNPSYFITFEKSNKEVWLANVLYETKLEHLQFTPSDECVNIEFVNLDKVSGLNVCSNVLTLAKMFDPDNH